MRIFTMLDGDEVQQSFFLHLLNMPFLKHLKLKIGIPSARRLDNVLGVSSWRAEGIRK
jgi:hypothetical protein